MRCKKANEYLSWEMDGVLPPDVTVVLQDHLDSCEDCRQYRQELHLGSRLLAATEPELSENFDWKLQLRLNQTLKETAGEVAYPWTDQPSDRWNWFRNFGTAAAMGLAAVLAVAVFLGPVDQVPSPAGVSQQTALGSDRLPLESRLTYNPNLGRSVSSGSPFQRSVSQSGGLDRGWSGQNLEDLRTINSLRAENRNLGRRLLQTQLQIRLMRAQLDSTEEKPLDLPEETK